MRTSRCIWWRWRARIARPTRGQGAEVAPATDAAQRIPYEREGRIRFVGIDDVAAIRAEGHYTVLYFGDSKALCPWSISESARRLPGDDMIRTHRSYIVNRRHVSGFERKMDTGVVFFEGVGAIAKAPVSRARLNAVRDHLGL